MLLDKFLLLFETDASDAEQDVKGLKQELGETTKGAHQAAKGMDDAGKSADGMAINFADAAKSAAGLLASFFALSTISEQITMTANYTDQLGKLAQTYDLNIQKIDAWGAAVERNGGSAQAFQSNIVNMQTKLDDIQFGGGTEIITTLSMMGVSAFDAQGRIKDTTNILRDLSGVFEGMSKRKSASLGQRLGLDQGTILLLQQGRDSIDQLVSRQEMLADTTEESYIASANFNDSMDDMKRGFMGVWQTINTAILPILTDFINGITDIILWMRKNKDFTVGFFLAIAGVLTRLLIPAVYSLATGFAALSWPIVLIGALAAAFALLYEDVKAYVNGNESLLGDLAKKYDWFKTILDGFIAGVKELWSDLNALFDWTLLLFKNPTEAMAMAKDKLWQELSDLWEMIKKLFDFSSLFDIDMSGKLKDIFSLDDDIDISGKVKGWFGFGGEETATAIENSRNIASTAAMYGANPLNTQNSYTTMYGSRSVYNTNNMSFNNNIEAKGATSEDIERVFTDQFGNQLVMAGGMIEDGIDR
jgi:hypothetical protein